MLQNGFLGNVLSALPNIKLSDLPNIDVSGGMSKGMIPPAGDPAKDIPQTVHQKFGNWTGSMDNQVMAKDLMNRGLTGADQIMNDQVMPNSADNIRNRQGDWKLAAVQNILSNAHKLNIRTPESVSTNWDVLNNGKWKDAINDPTFSVIHPNFKSVINSILKDQWAKEDAQNKNQTAKK